MVPRPHADETLRLFIAVPLEDSVRGAVEKRVRSLRERAWGDAVRWVRPENYHVTLRFLGDIASGDVPRLVACVGAQTAGLAPFTLQLASVRVFPSARRPRAVVQGIEPEAPLAELALAVEGGVQEAGFAAQERRFRPNLTLGRISGRKSHSLAEANDFPDTSDFAGPSGQSFEVCEVQLFRSELLSSGARYTVLERFPLVGGGEQQTSPHRSN